MAKVLNSAAGLAKARIGTADIVERGALAAPVADLLLDHEGLVVVRDGAAGLAEIRIGVAETAQRSALIVPIAGLPRDHEGLVVVLDSAAGLAEAPKGIGEIVERGTLVAPVAHLPRDQEMLLVVFDGAARAACAGWRRPCHPCCSRFAALMETCVAAYIVKARGTMVMQGRFGRLSEDSFGTVGTTIDGR